MKICAHRSPIASKLDAQQGQTLPLGLAAMLFTSVLVLMLFNTGQITSEKMRLTNAADAAVYSGLVWQARGLNFESYMNRAMVANQVSVAQVVSMVSWANYLGVASRNLAVATSWVPGLNAATNAFREASEITKNVVANVAKIAIPVLDGLLGMLGYAQQSMHIAAAVTTHEIVRKVVEKNDARYQISRLGAGFMVKNAKDWMGFTKKYEDDSELERKVAVINDSRDRFTRDRGWSMGFNVGIFGVKLVKAGETRLMSKAVQDTGNWSVGNSEKENNQSNKDWQWKSKDTASLHLRYPCWKTFGPGICRDEIPVGWGEALVSSNNADLEDCPDADDGWWALWQGCPAWSKNKRAELFADLEKNYISGSYHGIRGYRDIADLENKNLRLPLVLEISLDHRSVRTSTKVEGIGSPGQVQTQQNGMGEGVFRLADGFAKSKADSGKAQLAAISKGEVYFKRPVKRVSGKYGAKDSSEEFGSLYNPYWDTHLVSANRERLISWANRGVVDFSGFVGGGTGASIDR